MGHRQYGGGNAEAVVSVRMTPETHYAMKMLAVRSGKTVSRILREYAESQTGRKGRTTYREDVLGRG